jgi:hypothetical protein
MRGWPLRDAALGAFATLIVFFHPDAYPYAPVVGGLLVGWLGANGITNGLRRGVSTGLVLAPLALFGTLTVAWAPVSGMRTGIAVLFESMDGSGPQGPLFYLVVAYVMAVYTVIVAGLTLAIIGAIKSYASGRNPLGVPVGRKPSPQNLVSGGPELIARHWAVTSPIVRSTILSVAAAGTVVMYWWTEGFRLRLIGDASAFPGRCDILLSTPGQWFGSFQILRTTFQIPYCGVYGLGGVRGWIWAQIALWALTVVFIYRAGSVLFNDDLVGLLAAGSVIPLWETFRFAVRPQDDLMLVFTLSLALYVLAKEYRSSTRFWRIAVVISLMLVSFSRPLALPIAFGWILLKISEYANSSELSLRSPVVLAMGLTSLTLVLVFALLFLPQQLSIEHTMRSIDGGGSMMEAWANGIVVTHHSNPTFHYLYEPRMADTVLKWLVLNVDHLIIMGLFKATMFFVPVLPRWSTFHIAVNLLTLFPLILMAAAGTVRLLSARKFKITALLVVPVVMNVLTISIFYLDGGFNYRIPSTVSFALLSAYWLRTTAADYKLIDRIRQIVPGV